MVNYKCPHCGMVGENEDWNRSTIQLFTDSVDVVDIDDEFETAERLDLYYSCPNCYDEVWGANIEMVKRNNMLDMVCRELGVKINEAWLGNDGKTYIINNQGSIWEMGSPLLAFDVENVQSNWKKVMSGELKARWKPDYNDIYFAIDFMSSDGVAQGQWNDSDVDNALLKHGVIFKTKEEAVAHLEKLLENTI